MIYLTGSTNDDIEPGLLEQGIGLIVQPNSSYSSERISRFSCWGADNGCYTARWSEDPWLRFLDRRPRERCLFAVAPDVYPDATATLDRSWPYFELLREMGYPAALVAQDGAEQLDLPWDDFDCLFVGGEKKSPSRLEWKISAEAERLVREARRHGKWVHMGRVNSLKRMARARAMGCHSADGTFIGKAPRTNLPRSTVWFDWLDANPTLPDGLETPHLQVHREALAAHREAREMILAGLAAAQ